MDWHREAAYNVEKIERKKRFYAQALGSFIEEF
jgi:hypothetical protein